MVATDTVVGVAGAVLLAIVMVGVFVYEYNNTPPTTPGDKGHPSDAAKKVAFASAYPLLHASDDLDGDGLANYNDTDMDGNTMADANQTGDLVVRKAFPQAASATPPALTNDVHALVVGYGNHALHASLNYTALLPLPQAPRTNLDLVLTGPDGAEVRGTSVQNGVLVTVTIDAPNLAPGNYTLSVKEASPGGPSTNYDVNYAIDYGAAKPKA